MGTRVTELRCKEVINITDGLRLGFVSDVEVQLPEGKVLALVVPVPAAFFVSLGGRTTLSFPGTASAASVLISSWWRSSRTSAASPAANPSGFERHWDPKTGMFSRSSQILWDSPVFSKLHLTIPIPLW